MGDFCLRQQAITEFESLVQQRSGFCRTSVLEYGNDKTDGGHPTTILSQLCNVPLGIPFDVNGHIYTFDTAEHIFSFLAYGVPENVETWTQQGKLGNFGSTFGDSHGMVMSTKYGDLVGHIARVVVQPCRADIRAAHNLQLRKTAPPPLSSTSSAIPSGGSRSSCSATDQHYTYEFWRPILHAKFAPGTIAHKTLMDTSRKYLIDKDYCARWTGQIVFDGGSSTDGVLLRGNNRMGKFLMAIRAELQLMESSS